MKKTSLILILTMLVLTIGLTSCSHSANIYLDDVEVIVHKIEFIPTEYTSDYTHFMTFTMKGNPDDHYMTNNIYSLLEVYDKDNNRCSLSSLIEGNAVDIYSANSADATMAIICKKNPQSDELKLIFKDSINDFISSKGDELSISVDVMSDDTREKFISFEENKLESTTIGGSRVYNLNGGDVVSDHFKKAEELDLNSVESLNSISEDKLSDDLKNIFGEISPGKVTLPSPSETGGDKIAMLFYSGTKESNSMYSVKYDGSKKYNGGYNEYFSKMIAYIFKRDSTIDNIMVGLGTDEVLGSIIIKRTDELKTDESLFNNLDKYMVSGVFEQ